VSKCDRSDANRTMTDLKQMLTLGMVSADKDEWHPPVIGTSALSGSGLDELLGAIEKHRHVAFETEAGRQRRLSIANFRLRKTTETLLLERYGDAIAKAAAPLAAQLMAREADPYSLASELLDSSLSGGKSHEQDARSKFA
jgi:LAO/AO transport system kinase